MVQHSLAVVAGQARKSDRRAMSLVARGVPVVSSLVTFLPIDQAFTRLNEEGFSNGLEA